MFVKKSYVHIVYHKELADARIFKKNDGIFSEAIASLASMVVTALALLIKH